MQKISLLKQLIAQNIFRNAGMLLCNGENCIEAFRRQRTVDLSIASALVFSTTNNDDGDKFYLVLGLICNSIFLLASVGIFVLGFFVWKLFPFVKFYFLLLALLTLSLVIDVAWWSVELNQSSVDFTAARVSVMLFVLSGVNVGGKSLF